MQLEIMVKTSTTGFGPRHTGDFSLFRIYADKDNAPANYSVDNTPYKSKKHLTISTKGLNEGDFTMVMGYPGSTDEYIISDEINFMLNTDLPKKVAVRDARLKIIDKYMKQNEILPASCTPQNTGQLAMHGKSGRVLLSD